MMIVRVRGVKKVRARGRIYYYHRKTGLRITAPPGTAAFAAEADRLNRAVSEQQAAPLPGTLGGLFAAYRAAPDYARLAERTRADYERVFNYLGSLDRLPIVQLDEAAMLGIRDKAFAQRKRRFANHVLQALGTVLMWGKLRKLSLGNPLAKVRGVKIPRPADMPKANRPWTEPECAAVLGEARGGLRLAVALGMYACMRLGDAVRVTWAVYDGNALDWRQGKTGDSVWVPAHRELRALLDAAPRTATTIVTGVNGRPLKESGLAKSFRTLILRLRNAGRIGDGLTFHGLRHTNGNALADLGADPRMIQALLGHRSMAASLYYSDRADRRRAAAAAVHKLENRGRGTKDAR